MDGNSLISLLINWVLAALVIYVVSRLNLGLKVGGFVNALIAAAVVALIAWLIGLVLPDSWTNCGWIQALFSLIVSAVVLIVAARILPGMQVNGFQGALIAAIAIAVLSWIVWYFTGRNVDSLDALYLLTMFI